MTMFRHSASSRRMSYLAMVTVSQPASCCHNTACRRRISCLINISCSEVPEHNKMQHQRVAHGNASTQNGNMAHSGRRMAHGTERRRSVGRLHRDHMRSAGGPGRFQKKPTCSTAELEATAPVTACKPYTECDEYPSSEALHTYFFE